MFWRIGRFFTWLRWHHKGKPMIKYPGFNCGCCGKWVPDVITRSDLGGFFSGWTLCEECIHSSGETANES